MKKRFFSSLLLMAVSFFAISSVFVSCKDYDDEINANAEEIKSAQTLIKSLQEQLTVLESAAAEAQKTADAAKQAAADAATAASNAQKTGDDALAAAKTAQATAEAANKAAAEAKASAIEAATKLVNDLKSEVTTLLASKVDVETYNKKMGEIELKFTQLEGQIAGIDESLNKLGEDVKNNASEIQTLKEAVATLSATQSDMAVQIAALELYKQSLEGDVIPGLKAAIEANKGEINGVKQSLEEYVNQIKEAISSLSEQIVKNANDIAALTATVEALQANVNDLSTNVDGLNTDVKNLQSETGVLNTKISDLETLINTVKNDINERIDDVVEDLQKQIDALLQIQDENGNMTGLVDYLKNYTDTKLEDYLTKTEISTRLKALEDKFYDELTALGLVVSQNKNEITAVVNSRIATLHILVAKRLTSMVYAPTTYVEGIEAITFATLQYQDWGLNEKDWEKDAAKRSNPTYVIDDALTEAVYHVSPSGVSLSDIASLEFISNNAVQITRSGNEAPIVVADKKLVNGKLVLNLKKTGTISFGKNLSEFMIVALKAKLADNVLTDDEKKAGAEVNVYSDWARLYETSKTPFIHNKTAVDEAGNISETSDASHFWSYSEVYNGGNKTTELPWNFNYKHIAKECIYNEAFDLMNLVDVCDKDGRIYDIEKYGLKFEFHLIDYILDNENETTDATNQKYFAKIEGTKIIPTSRDGKEYNRNAIGRMPMVQVVLKDVRDADHQKVVDVRYFKIAWTDKKEVVDLDKKIDPIVFEENYDCGEEYNLYVQEETMNEIYAALNMSRDEFHNTYKLRNEWLFDKDDVVKGASINGTLGEVFDRNDLTDPGQTHNLWWKFNTTDNKATQAEYEAGKKVVTAYGCFVNKSNPNNLLTFSMTLTLKIKKMALKDEVGRANDQWRDGERTINPITEKDSKYGLNIWNGTYYQYATTQMRGNFLAGYTLAGAVSKEPGRVEDLVNFYDEVSFVFDKDKLAAIATATKTNVTDWKVSNDGWTLYYKGNAAAYIDGSDIKLVETNEGSASSKSTEGSRKLIGISVPVKLDANWCGLYQKVEAYNVHFMKPLKLGKDVVEISLTDITAGGSTYEFNGTIEIKEDAVHNNRVVYDNKKTSSQTNKVLCGWYGFEDVKYDIANAKTNIQKNGTIGSVCNVNLKDIQNANGTPKYTVSVSSDNKKVTFNNMSGNAIGQSFKIEVPVVITTKWQIFTQKLVITIKPGF